MVGTADPGGRRGAGDEGPIRRRGTATRPKCRRRSGSGRRPRSWRSAGTSRSTRPSSFEPLAPRSLLPVSSPTVLDAAAADSVGVEVIWMRWRSGRESREMTSGGQLPGSVTVTERCVCIRRTSRPTNFARPSVTPTWGRQRNGSACHELEMGDAVARWLQRRRTTSLFSGLTVDRFTQQIGVAVVPGVLLDHVNQDPAQAGCTAVRPTATRQLSESAGRKRDLDLRPRPADRGVPDSEELVRRVVGRGVPVPVGIGPPSRPYPRVAAGVRRTTIERTNRPRHRPGV